MKIFSIEEPELEFGEGRHVDIRFGITNYGPLDYALPSAPKTIRLGLVGTTQTVEEARTWLQSCAQGVAAKSSPHPYLFPRFPGCTLETGLLSELQFDDSLTRHIAKSDIEGLAAVGQHKDRVAKASVIAWLAPSCSSFENGELL